MKQPLVDYSGFRLSRINEPRFSHLKLLLGWVIYFACYVLTENLIPLERCHLIHCGLDDLVPFTPIFLIPYVFWYLLTVGSLLHYLRHDVDRFRQLQIFIMITQAVAVIIYIVFPSRQDLRPDPLIQKSILTRIIGLIYSLDTPTGVCPSLHVAYSMGIASVWLKDKNAPLPWKGFVLIATVLISLSTTFIKQHSVVDILAALPVALLAECIVYGKCYYIPKFLNWKQSGAITTKGEKTHE